MSAMPENMLHGTTMTVMAARHFDGETFANVYCSYFDVNVFFCALV